MHQINNLDSGQAIGLKEMMNHGQHIKKIIKLDLKVQC